MVIDMEDKKEFPYEVYHPEGKGSPPKFRTWRKAIRWQKFWNIDIPGHRARKRRQWR